jgi:hypothetical protein
MKAFQTLTRRKKASRRLTMVHPPTSTQQSEPKLRPAIKYGIDALLIVVPLLGMTYFVFDPEAFNAFTAWLMGVL